MNGSTKLNRISWRLVMKLSDDTVSASTCMPARLMFSSITRATKARNASRHSGEVRTMVLNIWKSEDCCYQDELHVQRTEEIWGNMPGGFSVSL